jgi:transcriptional regulator with XRE-family HTH domain
LLKGEYTLELDYKALGKRIKIARINADMTQDRLSTMLEMSPSHMSNIETGSTRISLTALVSIANALGVTVDDLLYDSIVHARPQLERDIQQIVDSCDDYELRVVKDVTQSVVDALRANEKLRQDL